MMKKHPLSDLPCILLVIGLAGCGGDQAVEQQPAGDVYRRDLTPLTNTALRFDGCYHFAQGRNHYLLRFFPEGNVVLIAGTDSMPDQRNLRVYLRRDALNNTMDGLHNAPVIQQDDSLYFVTPTERGNIDYRGKILGADSVRFYKYSHITGSQLYNTYRFEPDAGS